MPPIPQGSISVEVKFNPENNNVDKQRTLKACRRALDNYEKENQEAINVLTANEQVWKKHSGLRSMSLATLTREILALLGKTIKKREALGDYESFVKELITLNQYPYHYISRGNRKGIHRIDRYGSGDFEKISGEENA